MNAPLFVLFILILAGSVAFAIWYYKKSNREPYGMYPVKKADESREEVTAQSTLDETFRLQGLPLVRAGHQIMNVPCIDPMSSGSYIGNYEVKTISVATVYTDVGIEKVDIVELDKDLIILVLGGKSLIMESRLPSMADEKNMDDTRCREYETVEFGTLNYDGRRWNVVGVYGINEDQKPGERENSYIEVLSTSPQLGKSGMQSTLPPAVLDGQSHNYYDLRADCPETEQVLFVIFVEGSWNIYVGRFMTRVEISQMQGV